MSRLAVKEFAAGDIMQMGEHGTVLSLKTQDNSSFLDFSLNMIAEKIKRA